jgi:hypothetical protein
MSQRWVWKTAWVLIEKQSPLPSVLALFVPRMEFVKCELPHSSQSPA